MNELKVVEAYNLPLIDTRIDFCCSVSDQERAVNGTISVNFLTYDMGWLSLLRLAQSDTKKASPFYFKVYLYGGRVALFLALEASVSHLGLPEHREGTSQGWRC